MDDSIVRNIDVVPTVADLLGTSVCWPHDGTSVFSAATKARERVAMPRRDFSHVVASAERSSERRRARGCGAGAGKFGTGRRASSFRRSVGLGVPHRTAPRAARRAVRPRRSRLGPRAAREVANAGLLTTSSPPKQILPTRVTGRLEGGAPGASARLAVAVNGRVRRSDAASACAAARASTSR